MKQTTASTHQHSTIPFPVPHPAGHGQGAPASAGPSAAGGAPRGRPSGCSDRVVAMMKDLIRRHGFSDTAAAEGVGVSSTTISRWKKQDPELAAELLQARHECRIHQLEIIEKAAEAENGRGWRAAAWILERLFPGDYSPKMMERFAYRNLEDQRRDREATDLVYDDVQVRLAEEKAQRAQAAAEAEQRASASEADLHNSRNSEETEQDSPARELSAASEAGSRNSRNAGEVEVHDGPAVATGLWPVPASASEEPGGGLDDAPDAGAQTAHRAVATTGAGEERFLSEIASRNCRNAEEPGQGTPAPACFTASDEASRNSRNAPRGGTPSAQFPASYAVL
jgi:hypothetical protein